MGDASNNAGTCHDLDVTDVERVTAFMAKVVRAFARADATLLEALSHPGDDPRNRLSSQEFNQSLMDGGDKVQSWSARPYTEPKWSIMRTVQHHPPPSIWIDVTLNNGKRNKAYCFALAPDTRGALRSCYYIDRVRRRKLDTVALRNWLAQPRTELAAAVTRGIRAHVASLRARGIDFYGYALHPGEPYNVSNIVAITNQEADIKAPPTDDRYQYYRLCVDEWKLWDHDQLTAANRLLAKANKQFDSMHSKDPSDYMMDKFEVAHSKALLDAILQGLLAAKKEGCFGDRKPFLVVWIQDSSNTMLRSVRCLNSKAVYQEFKKVLGDWVSAHRAIWPE